MNQLKKSTAYEKFDHSSLLLNDIVEPTNKLRRLASLVNWKLLRATYSSHFQSATAPPARMIFGLLYLQTKEELSEEELLERWLVTPEWQYFCGETTLQDSYPLHPSVLSIWRREIGVSGIKLMCAALAPSFVKLADH